MPADAAGAKRRTAAGVFFETLQLKTWNFIDVEQPEAFGDITVSKGPRFEENTDDVVTLEG